MLIIQSAHPPRIPPHRYWLWYTTQRLVSGTVRQVYQKLKQFKVQFLVLQRKNDLSQVMLQCLPSSKVYQPFFTSTFFHSCENAKRLFPDQVDSALKCLSEKYDGPQPSDLCNLLEGEQFFASFDMGLEIRTGLAPRSGPLK